MIRDIEREERAYSFSCRSCSAEWTRRFLVSLWIDEDGVELEGFTRSGVPVPNPTRGTVCPYCGSNLVTVSLLVHGHPVVAPQPKPGIPVTRPRSIPPRPKLRPRIRAFP